MTANDIAARYTMAQLSEMYAAAAKEMMETDKILNNDCLSETMKTTCKAYKQTLHQYAQLVFDAMKIKEKR